MKPLPRNHSTNTVIQTLRLRPIAVVRTRTRAMGDTYAFTDTLQIIPQRIGERLVSKGILSPANITPPIPGATVLTLSQEWC